MRRFRPSLVAGALALALSAGTASAQFTNTYIFGDSLSDGGQYGARFTTNPGLTAAMYVGQNFGLSTTPSTQGGSNFAFGGARMSASPGFPPTPPTASAVPIADQVTQLLSRGPLDSNALFQIQGGANDVFTLASNPNLTPAQVQAGVTQAALDLAAQAARLRAAGAQYVIVQNLPDMGKTPAAAAQGQQAQLTAIANLFNSTLNGAIGSGNVSVIQFNTSALLNEIIAQPSLYGFVNTTTPVCTTPSSIQCTPATLRDPNGNLTWVFADGVHPTTGADLVLAQAITSMITGPQQMAALGEAPMGVERANWRALDGRMRSSIGATGGPAAGPSKLQAWAAYDYANEDIFGTGLSGSGDINTISVGGDVLLTGQLLAGVQFGYSEYKGDFGNDNGDFKLREPMVTFYGGFGHGPWYAGVTFGVGSLDYSTSRNIQLGATTRTENGDTNGYHNVARLLGGYWFRYQNWDHGPFGKLTWEKIVVRQFSENGNDSTALTFGQQKVDTFLSSVGWQVAGNVSGFRPFARATWEYNFDGDTRQVSAKSNSLNGVYVVPGFEQDDNWWLFDAGVSREFGKVTGFLSGNASAGKGDGDYWAVTLGIRVPL
jgi:outer membrane lipase/esterase